MAEKLVNCKVCGKEVASKAIKCPHCGARTAYYKQIIICVVISIILLCIAQGIRIYYM